MAGTTYNSNKNVKRGQLIVKVLDDIVAYATTATITMNSNITDASNKFDGVWDTGIVTGLSYTVATEMLITDQEGTVSYKSLMDAYMNHEPISFEFGTLKRTVDESTGDVTGAALDTTMPSWKGSANISSLELSSEKKELPTGTLNLTGTGALIPVEAVTAES